MACKQSHALRVVVATHEANAGNFAHIFRNHIVESLNRKLLSPVLAKIRTVAAFATIGTKRKVYGKSRFVGYFLKNDVVSYKFQHPFTKSIIGFCLGGCSLHAVLVAHGIVIITACSLLLTVHGEIGNALQIAYDTCEIVNVLAVAHRTLFEVTLVNVSAVVAHCVRHIERKVIASLLCGNSEKLTILFLAQMFVEIHVESRAAGKVFYEFMSVKAELFKYVRVGIFNHVEITIVAVARNIVTVLPVPTCVLHTYVLGRNHFAVEHNILGTVFLVIVFHRAEYALNKFQILGIVGNSISQRFRSLNKTVNTYVRY